MFFLIFTKYHRFYHQTPQKVSPGLHMIGPRVQQDNQHGMTKPQQSVEKETRSGPAWPEADRTQRKREGPPDSRSHVTCAVLIFFFKSNDSFIYWFIDFRERKGEGGGREKDRFVVPLICAFMGCFAYVPWPGIEPATLEYRYGTLTNTATWLEPRSEFSYPHPALESKDLRLEFPLLK